eukprot:TRINITY_DN10073_c0_g1_i1.p3 TRINITY_DN10073_c0_g1~~TRINITY_DN10073_c0_g1_i1.p3  ORF type:complete len:51 (-),score=4.64 TRINITY_DN10073_c0_g1_i1:103-255(-)
MLPHPIIPTVDSLIVVPGSFVHAPPFTISLLPGILRAKEAYNRSPLAHRN